MLLAIGGLKMVGVHTDGVVAEMVQFRLIRLAVGSPVSKLVSSFPSLTILITPGKCSISVVSLPCHPMPTPIRLDLYFAPESLNRLFICLHIPPRK